MSDARAIEAWLATAPRDDDGALLATSLVLSGELVDAAGIDDVIDHGEHPLKGLAAPIRVFTRRL